MSNLTDREKEVANYIAKGKKNREIAEIMGITIKTARNHRSRMMHKIDAHNVQDVTRYVYYSLQ